MTHWLYVHKCVICKCKDLEKKSKYWNIKIIESLGLIYFLKCIVDFQSQNYQSAYEIFLFDQFWSK